MPIPPEDQNADGKANSPAPRAAFIRTNIAPADVVLFSKFSVFFISWVLSKGMTAS